MTTHCCADCGEEEGGDVSLKTCKACMLVKYCSANCQRNHWPKHKLVCKQRAAKLRDEALFNDPPAKEDCPICFLPMPKLLVSCISLPPATISSLPVYDFAKANEVLEDLSTERYYECCGKSICGGCFYSIRKSGNVMHCPFCNSDRDSRTDDERVEELIKRVEANDAGAIYVLGTYYCHGQLGLLRDREKAIELWKQATELGSSHAHFRLGIEYEQGGKLKKAKFHYEAAAMTGDEAARMNLACLENKSGNSERAVKHLRIAASAGCCRAMHTLLGVFYKGMVGRDEIDSILTAYNNSCAEMRSEARDEFILDLRTRSQPW